MSSQHCRPGCARGVNNPVDESESLTERLGNEGVEEAAKAFEEFEKDASAEPPTPAALHKPALGCRANSALAFRNEPDRVKVVSVAAATIAAAPATAGPSELVGRTKAG